MEADLEGIIARVRHAMSGTDTDSSVSRQGLGAGSSSGADSIFAQDHQRRYHQPALDRRDTQC
eukprot:2575003-Rhodomonas_salina.1